MTPTISWIELLFKRKLLNQPYSFWYIHFTLHFCLGWSVLERIIKNNQQNQLKPWGVIKYEGRGNDELFVFF